MENKRQPKVSVIVPIYNVEKYIERCVRSLMEQTLDDIEYIFVNDATPDGSMEVLNRVIDEYPQRKPYVTIFTHENNKGQSSARNLGIKNSTGKYIFFVDSDDEITTKAIESLYNIAEDNNSDLVIADNQIICNGEVLVVSSKIRETTIDDNKKLLKSYCAGEWYNVVWNKLIRTDILINNNLYFADNLKFEDELWTFQLASCVGKMSVIHDVLYSYYIHNNSTMTTIIGQNKWIRLIPILNKMGEWIIDKDLQKHPFVQRFFCLKLVQTLSNIKPLKYENYKSIANMTTFDVRSLYKQKAISIKEYVAYKYFDFPDAIGFVYYKAMQLLFTIKGLFRR